jgi:radical SAM protein with 4Fe4S-binding SPASM domain
MLRNLQRAGLDRGIVRLDGPNPRLNDALTGVPGSFNLALAILRDADSQDLRMEVHTVLTRHNICELNRMASLLSGLVLRRWNIEFFVPESKESAIERARPIQIEEAFEQIWEHAIHCPFEVTVTEAPHFRRYVMIREHNPAPPPDKPGYEHFKHVHTPLNDGRGEMFVAHDGTIYPGPHLPIEAGRFPEKSLAEVYRSEVFARLRECSSLRGKCRACDYNELCGGSRARAYAMTGNEFSSDPDCLYVPAGWKAESEPRLAAA